MKKRNRNTQCIKYAVARLGVFCGDDGGQANVEYAFILAFVTLTLIACLALLGQTVSQSMLPAAKDIR
jgi:Flp pilus assembly pilin Flp